MIKEACYNNRMEPDPQLESLEEALATFRSTRSAYQYGAEAATTGLLLALAQAVQRIAAAGPTAAPDPALLDELRRLREGLVALHQQQRAAQAELRELRQRVEALAGTRPGAGEPASVAERRRSTPPEPAREARPLAFWAERVPAYDDAEISPDAARQYLERPRIRPEDLQLTPDEIVRQPPPGRAAPSVSEELFRRAWEPAPGAPPAVRPEYALRMSCLSITLIAVLILALIWVWAVIF